MATKADLNKLAKLEAKYAPLAPVAQAQPIEVWRMSRTEPRLYRRESGGPWIEESEYLDQIGPPAPLAPGKKKNTLRLVEVLGDWPEFKNRDRTINQLSDFQEK